MACPPARRPRYWRVELILGNVTSIEEPVEIFEGAAATDDTVAIVTGGTEGVGNG